MNTIGISDQPVDRVDAPVARSDGDPDPDPTPERGGRSVAPSIEPVTRASHADSLFRGRVPRGFMVVILENADEAERAKSALGMVRFANQDLVVLSGQRLLAPTRHSSSQDVDPKDRWDPRRRAEVKERVLAYARAGRSVLWVKAANGTEADRALRVLADYRWLHVWYRDRAGQYDINTR